MPQSTPQSLPPSIEVPLLDLKAQYAPLRDEIQQAIARVCDSQQFVLGPEVGLLEREIAEYSGAALGLGVSSGTDALLLALMALDVGPGDEVITSSFTFFATAGVVARLNARPVFCDIDFPSFNLSPQAVERFLRTQCRRVDGVLINARTRGRIRAILPVHLFGQMADMSAFERLAEEHDLVLVEDAAQAIGAELADGRRAGSIGAIGCLSFFPTKNLGAFGDAGMCVTSDRALYERMRILRVHGGEPKYYHSVIGGNFRLDELQAAVLRIKLRRLDEWTAARQRNAELYTRLLTAADLGDAVTPPVIGAGQRHIFNQYVIRTPARDALREHLRARGIGTEIYYPLGMHQQRCFADLGYTDADLPNASLAAREVLALPIFPELGGDRIESVVTAVRGYFGR